MKRKSQRAFTITELVIVIAVIAILAAVLIPTFSSVVEKAKVGTDTANAKTFSTQLSVHMVDSDVTITESNAREYITSVLAVNLVPQSASYGYHYVYNMNTGMIELKKLDEVVDVKTVQLAKRMSTTRSADWGNTPETCFLKQGYVFLDTAGSELAEVVNAMHTLDSVEDLQNIISTINGGVSDENTTAGQKLAQFVDRTLFVSNGQNYTTATENNKATNIWFVDGVKYITSTTNIEGEEVKITDIANVVNIAPQTVVNVPATVEKVSKGSLSFGEEVTINFDISFDKTKIENTLEIGFTDGNFTFNSDVKYTLDGNNIVDENSNVVATLGTLFKVNNFDIKVAVKDQQTTGIVLEIAQDKIPSEGLKFTAYNFSSEFGPFVTESTEVAWSTSAGNITSDGVLTVSQNGTVIVTATATKGTVDTSDDLTKTFTLIIYGVSGAEIDWTGSPTIVPFNNGKSLTLEHDLAKGTTATFTVEPTFNFTKITEGIEINSNYSVSGQGATKTDKGFSVEFSGAGTYTFVVEFEAYEDIRYEIVVYAYDGVGDVFTYQDYDKTGIYYRFGNKEDSSVPIIFANNNIDGSNMVSAVEYPGFNAKVEFDWKTNTMTFSGAGKIRIVAQTADANGEKKILDSFLVEVVDGAENVSTVGQINSSTQDKLCLVGDITLSGDVSTLTVAEGKTLYGNGYTIDASASDVAYSDCLINLQGTMDNVIVFGFEPNTINLDKKNGGKWAASTVKMTKSGATISSSYIQGGQFVVEVNGISSGEVNVIDTTIVNGSICLAVINTQGQYSLNIDDVIFLQKERNEGFIGASIGFYEGGTDHEVTVNFKGQNNKFLNFWTYTNMQNGLSDTVSAMYGNLAGSFVKPGFAVGDYLYSSIWSVTEGGACHYNIEDVAYMNVGMLVMLEEEAVDPIMNFSESNLDGKMFSYSKSVAEISDKLGGLASLLGMNITVTYYGEKTNGITTDDINNWSEGLSAFEHKGIYAPLEPTVTLEDKRFEIADESETVDVESYLRSFTAQKHGVPASYSETAENNFNFYYTVEIKNSDGSVVSNDLWSKLPMGNYTVTYTVVDELVDAKYIFKYTSMLIVDVHREPLNIVLNDSNYDTNGINNPFDGGVDYQINAEIVANGERWGFIKKYYYKKAVYKLRLSDIISTIDKDLAATLTYTVKIDGISQNVSSLDDVITCGEETTPGDSDVRNKRYVKKYTVEIIVKDQYGQVDTETVTIAFYVDSLSGDNYWGGK